MLLCQSLVPIQRKSKHVLVSKLQAASNWSDPFLSWINYETSLIMPDYKFKMAAYLPRSNKPLGTRLILGRCNARYHRIRFLTNKKWGPSPSTILKINKQCVRPIFEYGSVLTITTSDTIISEIQPLQNKFIRLALRFPKYISVKLLHDSSGLPYVKDRLLSRATMTLERITVNPLVEESISSSTVNPAWDRFPAPLSVIRPVSL